MDIIPIKYQCCLLFHLFWETASCFGAFLWTHIASANFYWGAIVKSEKWIFKNSQNLLNKSPKHGGASAPPAPQLRPPCSNVRLLFSNVRYLTSFWRLSDVYKIPTITPVSPTLLNEIWKKRMFFIMLAKNGFRGSKVANCPSCFICSAKKLWISDEIMSTGMFKHFRSNV